MSKFQTLQLRHFESDVARAVFNDVGQIPKNPCIRSAEISLIQWLRETTPRNLQRLSRQIDTVLVPFMTPVMLRKMCVILNELSPQFISNMPYVKAYMTALSRAVHLSRFLCPEALERITQALHAEGLVVNRKP